MESYTHPMFLFEFVVSFGGAFLFLGMMWWDLRKENRKAAEAAEAARQAAATPAAPAPETPPAPDHQL